MDGISLGNVLTKGWEAFKKYMAVAIVSYLIYVAITAVAGNIPILNIAFYIVAMFPLAGGLYLLMLRIVKDENPQIGDIFQGFNDLVRWMGVGWLLALYMAIPALVCAIPAGIGAWLMSRGAFGAVIGVLFIIVAVILAIGIAVTLYMRWVFAFFVAAEEGASASAALQRSTELTEGIRLPLLGYVIVIGLVGWAGVIALGVGVLFTAPLAMCAFTALYLDVKNLRSPQAAAQPQVQAQPEPPVQQQAEPEPPAPAEPEPTDPSDPAA